jgi:hypothetical protein
MAARLKQGRYINLDPYPGSKQICSSSARFEPCQPLKNVLFEVFAKWPSTPEGMVSFCNSYGRLTSDGVEQVDWLLHEQKYLRICLMLFKSGDPTELMKRLHASPIAGCKLTLRRTDDGLKPVLVPETLIQAIWLQFALHAASNTKLLSCERCGKPFEVGTGTKRRITAKFCSNACKVAAYKARQEA